MFSGTLIHSKCKTKFHVTFINIESKHSVFISFLVYKPIYIKEVILTVTVGFPTSKSVSGFTVYALLCVTITLSAVRKTAVYCIQYQ